MGVEETITSGLFILDDGRGMYILPPNQQTSIEYDGQVGIGSDLFFGLLSWMKKNGWNNKKVHESIEVSPIDKQYHDLVIGHKQELEARIKQGLGQAAVAVGDYELLLHDERKLKEFLRYYEDVQKAKKKLEGIKDRTSEEWKKHELELRNAEIQLKAIFIDQVDVHNGQASLAQAVARWPTVIVDFQSITDLDLPDEKDINDPEKVKSLEAEAATKIATKLGVSRAEGYILAVKQKLYREWKELFLKNVSERYARVKQLVEGRRKSVEQYREWLKPYIARHRMINESFGDPEAAAEFNQTVGWSSGTAAAAQEMKAWCWKRVPQSEYHKPSRERKEGEFLVDPYDDLVKNAVFGGKVTKDFDFSGWKWADVYEKKDGRTKYKGVRFIHNDKGERIEYKGGKKSILKSHPSVTPEMINEWVEKIKKESLDKAKPDSPDKNWGPMDPDTMYYFFMEIKAERWIYKGPTGQGESVGFTIKNNLVSQNVLLLKLLEMKVEEHEFQQYIDEILGYKAEHEGKVVSIDEIMKREYPSIFGEAENEKGAKPRSDDGGIISGIFSPFKDIFSEIGDTIGGFLNTYGFNYTWFKGKWGQHAPYERDFKDKVTSVFLKAAGGEFGGVQGQLRSMMGI